LKTYNENKTLLALTLLAMLFAGLMYYYGLQKKDYRETDRNISAISLKLEKIYSNLPANRRYYSLNYCNGKIYIIGIDINPSGANQSIDELDSTGVYLKSFANNGNAKRQFEVDAYGIYNSEDNYGDRTSFIFERNYSDSILYSYQSDKQILENLRIGKHEYILKIGGPNRMIYSFIDDYNIVNIKTGVVKNIEVKLKDSASYYQRYGFFVKGNNGINYKIAREAGMFFAFNDSGRILYQAETVDKSPPLEFVKTPDGGIRRAPNSYGLANMSGIVLRNYLLILEVNRANGNADPIIDVYDQVTGKYKSSWIVPKAKDEKVYEIQSINDHQLILLYETTIGYLTIPESLL